MSGGFQVYDIQGRFLAGKWAASSSLCLYEFSCLHSSAIFPLKVAATVSRMVPSPKPGIQQADELALHHTTAHSSFVQLSNEIPDCPLGAAGESSREAESVGSKPRGSATRKNTLLGLITVSIVVLVFTVLNCRRSQGKVVREGLRSRRLGEGGNQEDAGEMGYSSEVRELCLLLGIEITDTEEGFDDTPLLSPATQDLLLEQAEDFQGSADDLLASFLELPDWVEDSKPLPVRLGEKRAASDDIADNEETPSQSQKAPRKSPPEALPGGTVLGPVEPEFSETRAQDHSTLAVGLLGEGANAFAAASSTGEVQQELLSWLDSSLQDIVAPESSTSSPPVHEEAANIHPASAGLQPSSVLTSTSVLLRHHPYIWYPSLQPGVVVRPFRPFIAFLPFLLERSHTRLLGGMREVFRRPSINKQDAELLVTLSELLVNHASITMVAPVRKKHLNKVVSCLGRRFLVWNYLHSTARALCQNWPHDTWWKELAARMPEEVPDSCQEQRKSRLKINNCLLGRELAAAITLYKSGSAPSEETVIGLKRKLFCTKDSPKDFRQMTSWAPWRHDGLQQTSTG
ncbi:hypothetical protein Efla_001935 [Eimeria flavescens]